MGEGTPSGEPVIRPGVPGNGLCIQHHEECFAHGTAPTERISASPFLLVHKSSQEEKQVSKGFVGSVGYNLESVDEYTNREI